jgi:hypothetical protein
MDTNRQVAPRWRRAQSVKLWLMAAALLALAGFIKVEAGSHGIRHEIAAGDAQGAGPLRRLATRLDKDVSADMPDEYRAIRPAGVDGAMPAIPPSETWPAQ